MGSRASEDTSHLRFVEYARARQHDLVRVAWLLTVDASQAEALSRDALGLLAANWTHEGHLHPDLTVRRHVYRSVLRGPARHVDDLPAGGHQSMDGPGARDTAVLRALAALTPIERAALVLRYVDEYDGAAATAVSGTSDDAIRTARRDALARLDDTLASTLSRTDHSAASEGVRRLLDEAAADAPDPDLAEEAWSRGRLGRRRLHRRTALGVLGATAGAAVVAVLIRAADEPEAPPARERSVGAELEVVEVDGAVVHLAPEPAAEALLPMWPDRAALAIPAMVGPSDPLSVRDFGDGVRGIVNAAFIVRSRSALSGDQSHNRPGGLDVVLLAPEEDPPLRWVALATRDPSIAIRRYVGPRSISSDATRVALVEPGRVVVVDARDGTVDTVEVPDPSLLTVGWARDDVTLVARSRSRIRWEGVGSDYQAWLVDTTVGSVTRSDGPAFPDSCDLDFRDGANRVDEFSPGGTLVGSRTVAGPAAVPTGESEAVATADGWVAAEVLLAQGYPGAAGRQRGLMAVRAGTHPQPMLLASGAGAPELRRYRPLGWTSGHVLLLESAPRVENGEATHVLAWDAQVGRLWRVGEVQPVQGSTSWFTGTWAL